MDITSNILHISTVQILLYTYISLFGMALGSFIALAVVRIPQGESILSPRSHCRHCDHVLSWYENIPIFSYLFLRGRCRKCHEKISPFYLIIEVLTLAVTLLAFHELRPWYRFVLYLTTFIAPVLILIFTDWKWLLLPDILTLPGIVVGFLVHWVDKKFILSSFHSVSSFKLIGESLLGSLSASLTLFLLALLYQKLRGKEGMGGGDIKLAAMLGAFFGWQEIFFIFFLASLLGLFLGVLLILIRRQKMDMPVPFGTCLGAMAILHLFYGPALLTAYLGALHHLF